MTIAQATFVEKQEQANRIEGQFDTLKDRVIAAGYGNKYSWFLPKYIVKRQNILTTDKIL